MVDGGLRRRHTTCRAENSNSISRKSTRSLVEEEAKIRNILQNELDSKIACMSTNVSKIQFEIYEHAIDHYFLKHVLTPYLHSVYYCLIDKGTKDYLSANRTREYLNMPFLIGMRVCNIINANGDERIDPDEFVLFFLKLLMGSKE